MPETLLDFDTADASGNRGAATALNLKASGLDFHITENVCYDAGWLMPIANAHLDLAITHAKPSLKGA